VFLLLTGHRLGWTSLVLLGLLILQFVFSFGLGLILSTLNVFFRDVSQLVGVGLQFWFWLTPIIYLEEILPQIARGMLYLNPMYYFVRGYQVVVMHDVLPPVWLVGTASALAGAALAAGSMVFFRLKDEIVDEV
jgi:lipopolysaccharide transport system permease protein